MDKGLAVVTGASSGIGRELARIAGQEGYDLLLVADEAAVEQAAHEERNAGHSAEAVIADLSTAAGTERMMSAVGEREIALFFVNAGRGYGGAFIDHDFDHVEEVIALNVLEPLRQVHEVARRMAVAGGGRILFTGSIAGFVPGTLNAVYHATKAFIDLFALALRRELWDEKVVVTCLMPGATDTRFFERAGMEHTNIGESRKADPAGVARTGFDALMSDDDKEVAGLLNKLRVAGAGVLPAGWLAAQTERQNSPSDG